MVQVANPEAFSLATGEAGLATRCFDAYLRALDDAVDPQATLSATVRAAASLAGASRVALFLSDDAGAELVRVAECGHDPSRPSVDRFPLDHEVSHGLLQAKPFIGPPADLGQGPLFAFVRGGDSLVWPAAVLPLASQGVLLGVFIMVYSGSLPADLLDKPCFARFLTQAAIAARNARAIESLNTRIRNLAAVVSLNEVITTTPRFEEVLEHIIDRVKQLIDVEMVGLMLYDPQTGELALQKPFRASEELIRQYRVPLSGHGSAVHAFRTGKPYLTNNVPNDPHVLQHFAKLYGARNSISVPLEVDNRRIGVFHVVNKRGGDFTDNDLRLVSLLASHLATQIENAQLLESQRSSVAQLQELNRVIDRQREGVERTLAIHDEFTRMILDGQGIAAIVGTLSRLLANPVAAEDRFSHLLAYHPAPHESSLDHERLLTIANGGTSEVVRNDPTVRAALTRLGQSRRPMRLAPMPHLGLEKPRVVAPIVVDNETMGYLFVLESNRTIDELDFMAVERAAMAMALQMMKENAAAQALYKLRGDLIAELLSGSYGPEEIVINRATFLGVDLRAPRTPLLIEVDDFVPVGNKSRAQVEVVALKAKLLDVLERQCERSSPRSIVSTKGHEIIVLAELLADTEDKDAALSAFADSLRAEVVHWLPEITVSVGIGGHCVRLADYSRSYLQARRALDVVKALRQRDRTMRFDQLGIYSILFDPHNRAGLSAFVSETIGPLLEYDRRHHSQLTETLHQYLLQDCRLDHAAEVLHVHVNTLRYRLQRIEALAKTDLHGFKARYNLHLALEVLYGLQLA